MRTLGMLVSIGCVALTACVGHIGGDSPGGGKADTPPAGTTSAKSDAFECDPDATALTASPIKRLAKVYFSQALEEFLSQLGDASRDALMASIQTRLDLVPEDISDYYSTNDDQVSQDHVDAVFGVAITLASKITDDGYGPELMAICGAGATASSLEEPACLSAFLQHYGRKAFRRPLSEAELDDFESFYHAATASGIDGLGALVARLVAHPGFYYRLDSEGEAVDGTEGDDAVHLLTKWELLSKITFLFWAAPPSDALYDRVETTDITEDDALSALVADVLADPRAERGILGFYREWFLLDDTQRPATEGDLMAGQALIAAAGLEGLPDTHRDDMIQEVLDLAKHYTLSTEGRFEDILTSGYSFARTPALATIYGVEPWDGTPDHLVAFPDGERSGLLTRAAMVASNAEYTRPIIKGKLVRSRLLCTSMPPPPADLDIKPLTHPSDKTTRTAVEEATGADQCQTCHQLMNPLGFASENYDPLGRARDKELRFEEGTGKIVSQLDIDTEVIPKLFDGDTKPAADAIELSADLAASGKADTCLVRNYFQFVTGRAEDEKADGCDLVGLREELVRSGGSLKAMLEATVMQEAFRRRRVE